MPYGLLVHLPIKYTAKYGIFSQIHKFLIDFFLFIAHFLCFSVFFGVFCTLLGCFLVYFGAFCVFGAHIYIMCVCVYMNTQLY